MTGTGQIAPTPGDIERLARIALERLPEPFADYLDGVLLIVEDFVDDAILEELGIDDPFALTGLYSGRPVGEPIATGEPPATIHLYRRPILDEWCEGSEALDHLVAHVLIHEVGHHFGLSDAAIHALEEGGR